MKIWDIFLRKKHDKFHLNSCPNFISYAHVMERAVSFHISWDVFYWHWVSFVVCANANTLPWDVGYLKSLKHKLKNKVKTQLVKIEKLKILDWIPNIILFYQMIKKRTHFIFSFILELWNINVLSLNVIIVSYHFSFVWHGIIWKFISLFLWEIHSPEKNALTCLKIFLKKNCSVIIFSQLRVYLVSQKKTLQQQP